MNKKLFSLIFAMLLISGVAFAALALVGYWTGNQESTLQIDEGESAEFYAHFFTTQKPVEYSVKLYDNGYLIYTFDDRTINSYDYWSYYTVNEAKYGEAGTYTVEIRGEDAGGSISTKILTLIVNEVSEPEDLEFTGIDVSAYPKSGEEPLTVSFTCNAEGGNTPITYSWSFGDYALSNEQNPTHTYYDEGVYYAVCTAHDADDDVISDEVRIDVYGSQEINEAPVLAGIPDVHVESDEEAVNIVDLWKYTSDDHDNDAELSFNIISQTNPGLIGCTIMSDRYVSCNRPHSDYGYSDITVRVIDTGGLADTDMFRITVISDGDENRAPVLEHIGDQTARVGKRFYLDVDAYDPDGDKLYFKDNTDLFDINRDTGEIVFTPDKHEIGTHSVTVCVRDRFDYIEGTLEDCETFDIKIKSKPSGDDDDDDDDDDEDEGRTEITFNDCLDDGDGDKYGTYKQITREYDEDGDLIDEDIVEMTCVLPSDGDGFIVNIGDGFKQEEKKLDPFWIFITALLFVALMLLIIFSIYKLVKRY